VKQKARISTTIGSLLILSGCIFAQGIQSEPAPALPSTVLGSDLILWSQMQTPQPLPPDHNRGAQQEPTAEIFEGTITTDGATYILKVNNGATYRLSDQDFGDQNNVKKYDGKRVRLIGSLDTNCNCLRVVSIQLVS
jgi:hypothetical protein